jgi:hypothetical protein
VKLEAVVIKHLNGKLVQVLLLQTCFREVPSSDLSQDTVFLTVLFYGFPYFFQASVGAVRHIMVGPLPSATVLNHYLLTILPFDAMTLQSELLT